jgi:hypothetical protein
VEGVGRPGKQEAVLHAHVGADGAVDFNKPLVVPGRQQVVAGKQAAEDQRPKQLSSGPKPIRYRLPWKKHDKACGKQDEVAAHNAGWGVGVPERGNWERDAGNL